MCGARSANHEQDVPHIVFKLLRMHVLSNEEASLFSCALWSIWRQRNNKIWNEMIDAQSCV